MSCSLQGYFIPMHVAILQTKILVHLCCAHLCSMILTDTSERKGASGGRSRGCFGSHGPGGSSLAQGDGESPELRRSSRASAGLHRQAEKILHHPRFYFG